MHILDNFLLKYCKLLLLQKMATLTAVGSEGPCVCNMLWFLYLYKKNKTELNLYSKKIYPKYVQVSSYTKSISNIQTCDFNPTVK